MVAALNTITFENEVPLPPLLIEAADHELQRT
jgi:hypothetical protein